MNKSLKDYVKENQKFLKLKDGEVFDGTYHGYIMGITPDGKESPVYKVKYLDGKSVLFQTTSMKVAMTFDEIPEGSAIRIKRSGLMKDTKYDITTP